MVRLKAGLPWMLLISASWISALLLLPACEDDPVRGLDHGDFQILPFESALSDIETDVARGVIYVADERNNQIHVLDAETDELIRSIAVGSKPIRIVMDPSHSELFVAVQGEHAVAIVDPDLGIVKRRVQVPYEVSWLDVTGDGRLFVGPPDIDDGETLAIDSNTGEILHDLRVMGGWSPVGEFTCVADSVFLLVRTDDLFKWDIRDPQASVYSGTAELDMFHSEHELFTSNDGSLVYISGTMGRANQVEVYNISDLTKAGEFDTDQGVEYACLAPDGSKAFVATGIQPMAQGSSAATYILEFDAYSYARTNQHLALGSMADARLTVSPGGDKLYVIIDNPYRIADNPTQERRQDIQVIRLR